MLSASRFARSANIMYKEENMTLSLCMIVKDEQDTLARILAKAKRFCDEIIIVDTGSLDDTVKIAREFTDKIYEIPFEDFSSSRNYSLRKATCDYVMWLDADDDIEEKNISELIALKERLEGIDMVMLPYETAFDEDGNSVFSYYRERIFKNKKGFFFEGKVHEAIALRGNVVYENIAIRHRKTKARLPLRNLNIYQKTMAEGELLGTRELFYLANEFYQNNMPVQALATYREFQKRKDFIAVNLIQSFVNVSNILVEEEKYSEAFEEICRSFAFALPTPTVYCQAGYVLHKWKKYKLSNYFYSLATTVKETDPLAFYDSDYDGYVPYVQMGLNSYLSGDIDKAIEYTSKALEIKPYGKTALDNNAFYLLQKISAKKFANRKGNV